MTFNDLPMVLQQVLNKIERLEQVLDGIKEEMTKNHKPKDHVPMTLDEMRKLAKQKKKNAKVNSNFKKKMRDSGF